jgi:hypothetical protein
MLLAGRSRPFQVLHHSRHCKLGPPSQGNCTPADIGPRSYLSNNQYTSPPSSLPNSITSLSLTSNPSLSGDVSSQICTSPALTSCDLRNTNLGGSTTGQTSLVNVTATRTIQQVGVANGSVVSSASLTVGTVQATATVTAKVCGACLFA